MIIRYPLGVRFRLYPDRNYARKDQSGDPFQSDVCWNCKQEYLVYRKGAECYVGGCEEIATPLILGNTEVRECNKHIQKRFERTETVANSPLKATLQSTTDEIYFVLSVAQEASVHFICR